VGFVENLVLFPAVKKILKIRQELTKLSPWVWCTTFWDTV